MNEKTTEFETFLSYTASLLSHVHWIQQDFSLLPKKKHTATTIEYTDILERRVDFVNELINTISSWVYNKAEVKKLYDERFAQTGDLANALTFVTRRAFSKFRPGHPHGQFGELLLFNFVQCFFKAAPLLRKMKITTSPGHERFGADAIHFKKDGDENLFFLGESKCYESKYKFKKAFETSLASIESTFCNFEKEMDLYTYEDFIEPGLEELAKKFKTNSLPNVKFELVCLIAYNETNKITGSNEKAIKESILKIIKERCKSIDQNVYMNIKDKNILSRINYIIFPIWNLDSLLQEFQKKIGSL